LHRGTPAQGEAALQRLLHQAGSLPIVEGDVQHFVALADLLARCVSGSGLQPGGYAVQVQRAPWLDEHGLSVAYDAQSHFVFGRMQAEDFVR